MSWRREKSLGAFVKPEQLTSRLFYKKIPTGCSQK
jgi:hypothetical protein